MGSRLLEEKEIDRDEFPSLHIRKLCHRIRIAKSDQAARFKALECVLFEVMDQHRYHRSQLFQAIRHPLFDLKGRALKLSHLAAWSDLIHFPHFFLLNKRGRERV